MCEGAIAEERRGENKHDHNVDEGVAATKVGAASPEPWQRLAGSSPVDRVIASMG